MKQRILKYKPCTSTALTGAEAFSLVGMSPIVLVIWLNQSLESVSSSSDAAADRPRCETSCSVFSLSLCAGVADQASVQSMLTTNSANRNKSQMSLLR